MRRTLMAITVVILAAGGSLFWLKGEYDTMMFVPRVEDRQRMEAALRERFGSKVRLIEVPVVNRDVNGIVGYVEVPAGWRFTVYVSDSSVFSFEYFRGRPICLKTMALWELRDLRRTLQRRG
jgi:hypothetical protein